MKNISTKKLGQLTIITWIVLLAVAIMLSVYSAKQREAEKDRAGSLQSVTRRI